MKSKNYIIFDKITNFWYYSVIPPLYVDFFERGISYLGLFVTCANSSLNLIRENISNTSTMFSAQAVYK